MTVLGFVWVVLVAVFFGIVGLGLWWCVVMVALTIAERVKGRLARRRRQRREEIERALDRKQTELRRTVLALADALAEERLAADRTSKEIVARGYLATGRVP